MTLQMCIPSVQQRNRSVLPLNHENVVCVKEIYTKTYIIEYIKLCEYMKMLGIVKHKLSLSTFLHKYIILSCERY
jgi:hypothetical protein